MKLPKTIPSLLLLALLGPGPSALAQERKAPDKKAPAKLKLPEGVKTELDLEYGPHERNKLDIYVPKGEGPFPLIIWVHGGGWQAGSKNGGNPALRLLEKGFAVAAINYRLSSQAVFPAQINDCIEYICKSNPPFLIVHGDKDPLVPVKQSEILHEALRNANVDSTLIVVPGAGHGPGIGTPENARKVEEFFTKHLKPKR